ncbi:hypothetical protein ABPG77_007907 [Micractinium sp. CCAP 211/92]
MSGAYCQPCAANTLPETLLGHIFGLCGREHAPAISLVCRLWWHAVLAEPALWSAQHLGPGSLLKLPLHDQLERLASRQRLLAATAAVTTSLELLAAGAICSVPPPRGAATGSQLAALLRALRRAPLVDLTLACGEKQVYGSERKFSDVLHTLDFLRRLPCLPAAAVRVLPHFDQLTALSMQSWQLPACTAAVLLKLPQLLNLHLAARQLPASIVDSLKQLTALTSLELQVVVALPSLQQLQGHPCLQRLHLACYMEQLSVEPLPPVSAFPAVRKIAAACNHCSFSNQGRVPRLEVADAAPIVWCKCAVLEGRGASIHLFLAPALRHPGALQHLLAALMPGGDVPLVELGLHGVGFCPGDAVAVLRGCTLLRTLRRLDFLTNRYNPEVGADQAVLSALLEQTPALSELTVSRLVRLPESLVNRRGFRKLDLKNSPLRDLLPGPYLEVSRADVDGVLLRLPRLEHVDLGGARLTAAAAVELARAAARLEIQAADK